MDNHKQLKDNIKDTNKGGGLVLSNIPNIDLYHKEIILKTERVVSALYLVTNLIDDKDSLKWSIRDICLNILSDLHYIGHKNIKDNILTLMSCRITERLSNVISFLEVGFVGGLFSSMNYTILKRECLVLKQKISGSKISGGVESVVITDELLAINWEKMEDVKDDTIVSTRGSIKDTLGGDSVKDNRSVEVDNDTVTISVATSKGSDRTIDKRHVNIKKKNHVNRPDIQLNPRKDLIVRLMKMDVNYSIKDIILLLHSSPNNGNMDCSEKTIQRDLLALVSAGSISKKGERRWSRYTRVKSLD